MLESLFEVFLKEKLYLGGVSPKTISSYQDVFKRWMRVVGDELPTYENVKTFVIGMTDAKLSPTTINISIRSWNVFLWWLHEYEHIPKPIKIQRIKEVKQEMIPISEDDMVKLVNWRPDPNNRTETRLFTILSTLADTGLRINECLTIDINNIYWDDFLIFVVGKGKRERFAPMSPELRKSLFQYVHKYRKTNTQTDLLFCTINGTKMSYQNLYRDANKLMDKLGIRSEKFDGFFHTFRRFYAKMYMKKGGNLLYLQRALGHSNITTTKAYVLVDTEDLKDTHAKTSPLANLKKK